MYVRKVENYFNWLQTVLFGIMFVFTLVNLFVYTHPKNHVIRNTAPTKLAAHTYPVVPTQLVYIKDRGDWVDYSSVDTP